MSAECWREFGCSFSLHALGWLNYPLMKLRLLAGFGIFLAVGASGQTNIVFPELLSPSETVLMTNAEFRCLTGGKLCFRSGLSDYRSYEAAKLHTNVLLKLGFTLEDLQKRQAAFDQKNKLATAAYAAQAAALAQQRQQAELKAQSDAEKLASFNATNAATANPAIKKTNGNTKKRRNG